MRIKKGAVLAGLDLRMRNVLQTADQIWALHGQELWVTAGLDGEHSAGSLHYYGLALDLRTRYFDKPTLRKVAEKLEKALGKNYDVVVHKSHIHVEYDPKV